MKMYWLIGVLGICFIAFGLTEQEKAELRMDCGKEISANTSMQRKDLSRLKADYLGLKEELVKSDSSYQQLSIEKDSILAQIKVSGSTAALQNSLSAVDAQMVTVRSSISDSQEMLDVLGEIDVRKAALDTLKQQVMATSTLCQQAYAE